LISRTENSILISPIGDFSPELIDAIGWEITRVFGFPIGVQSLLADLNFAYDANRNQFHSTLILDALAQKTPQEYMKVLAVVQVDLFIPILTHVYGEAQLNGTASVISTFRLNEGLSAIEITEKYQERIVKEAIHELGHTFNLRHCPELSCIMHYCRDESDVDRKSDQLCRYCKIMLDDEIKKSGR